MKFRPSAHRRRYGQDEIDSEGSWAISYGDMVTLLLCFFILFFTIDPRQEHQSKLQTAVFSILDKNAGAMVKDQQTETAESGDAAHGKTNSLSMGNGSKEGLDNQLLNQFNGVPHKVGQRIVIEFPAISFFRSGQVDLTRAGRQALKKFVNLYLPYAGQYKLVVRAFTDVRPVLNRRSAYRDNLELSALRSVAAMRVLTESGIPLHKMRLGGYGEFQLSKLQLATVPEDRRPAASLDLARKVILVIEPEEADL